MNSAQYSLHSTSDPSFYELHSKLYSSCRAEERQIPKLLIRELAASHELLPESTTDTTAAEVMDTVQLVFDGFRLQTSNDVVRVGAKSPACDLK